MASETRETLDFTVANHGSVWQFVPQTDNALEFAQAELGLEGWQWLGNTFNVEHGVAFLLMRQLIEDDWKIGPVEQGK